MDLTLEQLLAQFDTQMTKFASDDECKDEKKDEDKEDKKDDKSSDKEDKMPAFLKKDDDKEDKKEEDGQTKSASELGAEMARQIMEKTANMATNTQAQTAGKTLAQSLLQKLASAGDMTTEAGVPAGVAPNKNQIDNAQMEAEGAAAVKPMPTSDGLRPTGTINEIFDAMVADTLAQGAASHDQVHETGVAAQEGAVEDHAVPNQVKVAHVAQLLEQGVDFESAVSMVKQAAAELEDNFEKAAAVEILVNEEGVSFNDAVELVKLAEEEIRFEQDSMLKAAALEELMAEGINFDEAVEMIKQASAGDMTTESGIPEGVAPNKNQIDNAQMEAEGASYIKPMQTSDGLRPTGTINEIFDAIVADVKAQGAASVDQVHDTGVAKQEGDVEDHAVPNQVKVAKLNELIAQGVDFAEASELIKEAAAAAAFKEMVGAGKDLAVASGKLVGRYASTKGREAAGAAEALLNPKIHMESGMGRRAIMTEAAKSLGTNPLVLGGVGAAGATGAYAMSHKKEAAAAAAFKEMVGAGKDLAVASGKLVGRYASTKGREAAGAAEALVNPKIHMESGMGRRAIMTEAAKSLAKNPLVLGGVGTAGAGAYALSHKKKAAFEALVAGGVDFDQAAELVASKSMELFGE